MFHRAAPQLEAARVAQEKGKVYSLGRRESPGRLKALAYAAQEEALLRARLSYFRTRDNLWSELGMMSVHARARVYRETDVGWLCGNGTKVRSILDFIRLQG